MTYLLYNNDREFKIPPTLFGKTLQLHKDENGHEELIHISSGETLHVYLNFQIEIMDGNGRQALGPFKPQVLANYLPDPRPPGSIPPDDRLISLVYTNGSCVR